MSIHRRAKRSDTPGLRTGMSADAGERAFQELTGWTRSDAQTVSPAAPLWCCDARCTRPKPESAHLLESGELWTFHGHRILVVHGEPNSCGVYEATDAGAVVRTLSIPSWHQPSGGWRSPAWTVLVVHGLGVDLGRAAMKLVSSTYSAAPQPRPGDEACPSCGWPMLASGEPEAHQPVAKPAWAGARRLAHAIRCGWTCSLARARLAWT